jgi:hypothetical protein
MHLECGEVWGDGCMRTCADAYMLSAACAAAADLCRLLIQAMASCATLVACWRSRRGRWMRLCPGSHGAHNRGIVSLLLVPS